VPHRVCAMSMTQNTPDFGAVTSFEDGEVTIALRGTAEHGSAFALGAILDAAIDRHPASMVLDVAELESLGATGLLAVFDAEKRLAASGVTLTIRSPSVLVNRLLGIMESAETSRRERSLPNAAISDRSKWGRQVQCRRDSPQVSQPRIFAGSPLCRPIPT
jgi:anti-sigma B factor antagonist